MKLFFIFLYFAICCRAYNVTVEIQKGYFGQGLHWNAETQKLYFVDNDTINSYDPNTKIHEMVSIGK